ncbi:MAG: hypothetical protein KME31_22565 [Tolypothrix carrinoi HA7290-LM1]|nr:hypothetical protein [Tolypothrix carrinoi HA7290-LM1]
MGHGAWGSQCVGRLCRLEASGVMGHGKNRIYSPTRASPNFFNSQFPIPNAQCPMPIDNQQPTS